MLAKSRLATQVPGSPISTLRTHVLAPTWTPEVERVNAVRVSTTNRSSVETVPDSTDDASHNHLSGAVSCYLEDGANAHDCGTQQDGLLPPEHLADREGADGAEEAANVILFAWLTWSLEAGELRRCLTDGGDCPHRSRVLIALETQCVEEVRSDDNATFSLSACIAAGCSFDMTNSPNTP